MESRNRVSAVGKSHAHPQRPWPKSASAGLIAAMSAYREGINVVSRRSASTAAHDGATHVLRLFVDETTSADTNKTLIQC